MVTKQMPYCRCLTSPLSPLSSSLSPASSLPLNISGDQHQPFSKRHQGTHTHKKGIHRDLHIAPSAGRCRHCCCYPTIHGAVVERRFFLFLFSLRPQYVARLDATRLDSNAPTSSCRRRRLLAPFSREMFQMAVSLQSRASLPRSQLFFSSFADCPLVDERDAMATA